MVTQSQRIRVASDGVDTDASPDYVADARAPVVSNLLARAGRLVMRGAFQTSAAHVVTGKSSVLSGAMVFDAKALMTLHHGFDTNTEYHDLVTGAVTNLTGTGPAILRSRRYARIGDYVYGSGSPAPLNGHPLLRWPGVASLPTVLAQDTVAPSNHCDVAAHLERVFLLAAQVGTAAGGKSSLMWSKPGGTSAVAVLADWQDSVSGLYNQITVGELGNDPSVALGKIEPGLVIFKRNSIYLLSGRTPAAFSIRQVSSQEGCVSRDSVLNYRDGLYFLSDRGLQWYDGAQVTEVSAAVKSELTSAISKAVAFDRDASASTAGYYTVEDLGLGYIYVAVGQITHPATTAGVNTVTPLFQYIFDTARGRWLQVSINGFVPTGAFRGNNRAFISDGNYVGYGDTLVNPDSSGAQYGKDTVGATARAIEASWHSRLVRLSSPTHKSQIQRLMLDHTFLGGVASGWAVQLVDGTGTVLLTQSVPAVAALPPALYRFRHVFDCFAEASDVQLRVEWRDAAASALTKAELYDANVVFQPAAQRNPA